LHEDIYDTVKSKLVAATKQLTKGNPLLESTFIGPIISEKEAKRIQEWVDTAQRDGAKILCGGKRDGSFYDATILENVPKTTFLSQEEVFGPVVYLEKFKDFKHVCARVNESKYGLQAGVFTNNLQKAFYAYETLHVGGVVINDIPSVRVDSMPYGGMKDSGYGGKEGIKYAMETMSEIKSMIFKEAQNLK